MCEWFPDWRGQACAIVASGPSAAGADLAPLRGRARVIVINSSWVLAPWADVLYAADSRWWLAAGGAPGFAGLKVTADKTAAERFGLRLVSFVPCCYDITVDRPGMIGAGGHSGFHALNLAVQWGASPIVLVGFDMRVDMGLHWHPDHKQRNPEAHHMERWRMALDAQAPRLAGLGVAVLNASPVSRLRAFPRIDLAAYAAGLPNPSVGG